VKMQMTLEEFAKLLIESVKRMTLEEKAELRAAMAANEKEFLASLTAKGRAEFREAVRELKASGGWVN